MKPAHGFTLIEMMAAMAAGLLVVLAALAMLRQVRAGYLELEEHARQHENGRLALAHLSHIIAHAGHQPWDAARFEPASFTAIGGRSGSDGRDSVSIWLRGVPDKGLRNCSGAPFPLDVTRPVHYLLKLPTGRHRAAIIELLCIFVPKSGLGQDDEAVAESIDRLQLQYGVDSDDDGHADQWRPASAMTAALWGRVRLVRVALQMAPVTAHDLGPPLRLRFQTVVHLRNPQFPLKGAP